MPACRHSQIKEQVTDELLARAFAVSNNTHAWIDPVHGWLVVDSASSTKTDDVFKWLLRSIPNLPVTSLRVVRSPGEAMTNWLELDDAPAGFTIDQDAELTSTGGSKSTVRYVRHTLEADDIRRHIKAGKRCTKLALTWNDKVSFVLTDTLAIKRVAALDVLKENSSGDAKDDAERFDTDFVLMTGELTRLMSDVVVALGGEGAPEKGQLDIADIPSIEAGKSPRLSDYPGGEDPLYDQAVTIVREHKRASISLIQRHLRIGYN